MKGVEIHVWRARVRELEDLLKKTELFQQILLVQWLSAGTRVRFYISSFYCHRLYTKIKTITQTVNELEILQTCANTQGHMRHL